MVDEWSVPQVLVAGGGIAALETALALRALAGGQVHVTLISPAREFAYRALAPLKVFGGDAGGSRQLAAIAADLAVDHRRARLEAVAPARKVVRLSSGVRLSYDALVIAIGARAHVAVPGSLTFRDQRDTALLRQLLDDLDAQRVRRLAFAVPAGCSWPLPLYELALATAARAQARDTPLEAVLVTPERRPLEVFGPDGSRLVSRLLTRRGVSFRGESVPHTVRRDGNLLLDGGMVQTDRVVAGPRLGGQPVAGLPSNRWGMIPTHRSGRVQGLTDVYAAGDITAFPIKQGAVATQQADRLAHTILQTWGFTTREPRGGIVLRARLSDPDDPLLLSIELDELGRPLGNALQRPDLAHLPIANKVLGRYLTPYLETRAPDAVTS